MCAVKKPVKSEKKKEQKRPRPAAGESPAKRSKSEPKINAEIRWKTLEHSGVLFPPEYQPHGIRMLYDGTPVDLSPEQEEVATFFAVMKETDYMNKPIFLNNFWDGFSKNK